VNEDQPRVFTGFSGASSLDDQVWSGLADAEVDDGLIHGISVLLQQYQSPADQDIVNH
jgi:hypothetical protein